MTSARPDVALAITRAAQCLGSAAKIATVVIDCTGSGLWSVVD